MNSSTTDKFGSEIRRVIDYFRDEFDLSYAEAIGMLEIIKSELVQETMDDA